MIKIFCLMIIPMTLAFAEPSSSDLKTAPSISKLEILDDGANNVWLEVTVQTPANVRSAVDYFENHELGYNQAGYIGGIEIQHSIDGNEWQVCGLNYSPNYEQDEDNWSGIFETEYLNELHVESEVKAQARYTGAGANGDLRYSDWSNVSTLNEKLDFAASTWAKGELADADKMGLIPDRLKGEDLTKPITREEFAAVAVKVYEALTGNTATPAASNPFTDTSDTEVLKAYDLGITSGTSATTFSPTVVLNREQAATMLTNTYKKATMPGWTAATNGDYTLNYERTNTFADDDKISAWAKDSVYFMNTNNIISGVGDNKFAPKNTTSAEEAMGYANATREQALVIASKMVKNLK